MLLSLCRTTRDLTKVPPLERGVHPQSPQSARSLGYDRTSVGTAGPASGLVVLGGRHRLGGEPVKSPRPFHSPGPPPDDPRPRSVRDGDLGDRGGSMLRNRSDLLCVTEQSAPPNFADLPISHHRRRDYAPERAVHRTPPEALVCLSLFAVLAFSSS
jgi:hypothetical protein